MSIEKQKFEILENVFGRCQSVQNQRHGKEYVFFCPKCEHHKPKLSINIKKNCFKCWVCLWSGLNIFSAIKKYGTWNNISSWSQLTGEIDLSENNIDNILSLDEKRKEFDKEKIELPKEFETLATKKVTPTSSIALQYLKYERNLSFSDIVRWKIGYCSEGKYNKRIIIPSFDIQGNVNFFIARTYSKDSTIPYLNPSIPKDLIFNELFIDQTKPLVVTEGVFDAIVAGNGFPLLGSSIVENSKTFEFLVNFKNKIYIGLDKDAKEKQQKIVKLLLNYKEEIYCINVVPFKDIGSMTKEQFQKKFDEAKLCTNDNYLEYLME